MKTRISILLAGSILFTAVSVLAQKIKSDNLGMLKGQGEINIRYDYSGMAVGKFKTEAEYLQKSTEERNAKKPGSGDEWASKWNSNKASRYQPAFEEKFNDAAESCGLKVKPGAESAKYTLVVHTVFLEQGVETVVLGAAKSASTNLKIEVVETSAPDKVLATIEASDNKPRSNARMTVGGVPVNKEVYDYGARIAECYESAGKALGKYICKSLK
ncbi:MAG TPA: hypothetical protein PLK82_09155 [Bacteroidales bacterium]|nr:hypothetical protein [Bacteroidales bacterium]